MADIDATTTVEVVITDEPATIAEVRAALDTLEREGVPDTFSVTITQSHDRVYERDVPTDQQRREHRMTVTARRAAVTRG